MPISPYVKTKLKKSMPYQVALFLRLVRQNISTLRLMQKRGYRVLVGEGVWGTAVKTALRESVLAKGRLDYNESTVLMALDSHRQIRRLNACGKEPETVEWIEKYIKPGDVFYDIGANIGAYSFVAWARTKGNCRVYAFEPSFSTFAALSRNIFLNNCSGKIIPLYIALGAKTDLLTFEYTNITAGEAQHSLEGAIPEGGRPIRSVFSQPIEGYRLDDFIERWNIAEPNHIKIDVDGAERDVIRGAERTLRRQCVRSLLIEIDETMPLHQEIIPFLANIGFRVASKHQRVRATTFNYIFEK